MKTNLLRNRPKDWVIEDYFTPEEVQQAQFELDQMHERKRQLEINKIEKIKYLETIKPSLQFEDYLTQVVYFLITGDLHNNVRKGMLCNMWNRDQWLVIKEVIKKYDNSNQLIKMVEDYYTLSPDEKDEMFLADLTPQEQRSVGITVKTKKLKKSEILKQELKKILKGEKK